MIRRVIIGLLVGFIAYLIFSFLSNDQINRAKQLFQSHPAYQYYQVDRVITMIPSDSRGYGSTIVFYRDDSDCVYSLIITTDRMGDHFGNPSNAACQAI